MTCTREQRHQPSIANIAIPELKDVNVISMMITIAGGMKKMNNLNQKKMKTLHERLKQEYVTILQKESKKYPNAIKALDEEFRNKHHIMELNYGTVVSLTNFLALTNCNYQTILNLFEL